MVNSVTRCGMYTSSLRYTCPIGLLRRPITAVRISIVLNISRHHLLVVHDTKYIQLPRRWGGWGMGTDHSAIFPALSTFSPA